MFSWCPKDPEGKGCPATFLGISVSPTGASSLCHNAVARADAGTFSNAIASRFKVDFPTFNFVRKLSR